MNLQNYSSEKSHYKKRLLILTDTNFFTNVKLAAVVVQERTRINNTELFFCDYYFLGWPVKYTMKQTQEEQEENKRWTTLHFSAQSCIHRCRIDGWRDIG